tara:strand:- start:5735 stop:6358 length:624 start_codon:yes stop_codon:yes gene_type:complete
MAKRILPYRDYSEHDVVNLFSLDTTGKTLSTFVPSSSGDWDAGVVVSVSAGALPGDIPQLRATAGNNLKDYMGADYGSSHVGHHAYPYNGMTVTPAGGSGRALGITLRETLAFDENGEKMLYYPQKLDEAQGVLPGQTVPVLSKGLVLLAGSAFSSAPSLGDALEVDASNAGQLKTQSSGTVVGSVIAIGEESNDSTAKKYLCKISF